MFGYQFHSEKIGYSLHPDTIPKELSYLSYYQPVFNRTIKTFGSEKLVIQVLEHGKRCIASYQDVPEFYSFFVLIRDVGFVFTKQIPVSFYFKQSTGWVISEAILVERTNDRISFQLTVADMGGFGWKEKVSLNVLLKCDKWTRIVEEGFASYMTMPADKRYNILYEKRDNEFKLAIVDSVVENQEIYSVTLRDTEDNIIELCNRIMSADFGSPCTADIGPYATFIDYKAVNIYDD